MSKLGQIFFEKNCILRKCSDCIKDVKSTRFFGKCSSIPRKIHLKICSNLVNCARHCSISSLVQVFVQLVCTVMIYIHCQQYRKSSQPARQTLQLVLTIPLYQTCTRHALTPQYAQILKYDDRNVFYTEKL